MKAIFKLPMLTSRLKSGLNCWPLRLLLALSLAAEVASGPRSCRNRMELVIAIDASSASTAALFEDVKAAVKDIAADFTVGPADTRLALLSVGRQGARLLANLHQVQTVSQFNSAVDGVAFDSPGPADLAAVLKLAREQVLSTARALRTSKVLLLVKDRRPLAAAVADAAALRRATSEAAAVRAVGAAIQAIGVGGVWNRMELEALFGTEYLLLKNKNKALESVKSLNNLICVANCPDKGQSSQVPGLCYDGAKQVTSAAVTLGETAGISVCRREIQRSFTVCTGSQRCNSIDRVVGPCRPDGNASIESSWQTFDFKRQLCTTTKSVQTVNCKDSLKCTGQVADVIFLLDRSSSMGKNFPLVKRATSAVIESLTIGPDNVRVGIITFEFNAYMITSLGATSDKASLAKVVASIPDDIEIGKSTYTDFALSLARYEFYTNGRKGVAKFAFLITDGESSSPMNTFRETALIKNESVTLYAIGVGNVLVSELTTMTAPESDTNMFILTQFSQLESWSANFSKRVCIQLSAPNPKLCDDSVFMQSVSRCTQGRQLITRTVYNYDVQKKCIKTVQTTVEKTCRGKCIDPVDGSEYLEGATWMSRCHEFKCDTSKRLLPERSYCLAADGQCKSVGSQPFPCRDEKGNQFDNCRCTVQGGKLTMLIETQ